MANTQTSVPAFVASQVLTAQQQTEINTGIPVFATTVTRDAAFGGAGEKALAEGQFAYIEATNTTQYYDGAAWQSVAGSSALTFITSATLSTTSTSVNNCFSATYANYLIQLNITNATTNANINFRFRIGGVDTSANYDQTGDITGVVQAQFTLGSSANTVGFATMQIGGPNIADATAGSILFQGLNAGVLAPGFRSQFVHDGTTQFDGFTIFSTATLTGTVRIYGYSNS
jgi:hypothetical protein